MHGPGWHAPTEHLVVPLVEITDVSLHNLLDRKIGRHKVGVQVAFLVDHLEAALAIDKVGDRVVRRVLAG